MIEVLAPGLLTTVQDLGRPGYAHLGVSAAGAADPVSFRIANRLVGNDENAPAVEMTLQGGRFRFYRDSWLAVCGGEFEVPMWRPFQVAAGSELSFGGCRTGSRGYLAVRGGFEAPRVLGSVSSHVLSGLGPAALRKGDRLETGNRVVTEVGSPVVPWEIRKSIRVTLGSQSAGFSGAAMHEFLAGQWAVSERSNRQGVRLTGARIPAPDGGTMPSEGVALGAIQVPASGDPVILFVDSQTTGGYPVIANVATVDLCSVGQLRPRDTVTFTPVSFDEARRLLLEQEAWIRNVGYQL